MTKGKYIRTEEIRLKCQKSHIGKHNGEKNGMYGSKGANKGKKFSKETREKMSKTHVGFEGQHCSEEHKKKLSKISKGRRLSNKQKIDKAKKLNKHHLDLNYRNDNKSNILLLTNANHMRLHRFAYHYLVIKLGIKEVNKYVKWFYKYLKYKNIQN